MIRASVVIYSYEKKPWQFPAEADSSSAEQQRRPFKTLVLTAHEKLYRLMENCVDPEPPHPMDLRMPATEKMSVLGVFKAPNSSVVRASTDSVSFIGDDATAADAQRRELNRPLAEDPKVAAHRISLGHTEIQELSSSLASTEDLFGGIRILVRGAAVQRGRVAKLALGFDGDAQASLQHVRGYSSACGHAEARPVCQGTEVRDKIDAQSGEITHLRPNVLAAARYGVHPYRCREMRAA
jgi:hypothetical protein